MVLYGVNNNNNTQRNPNKMPSKSVSFSDEHYARLVSDQPENMNFSEWVETLTGEALDKRQDEQDDGTTSTEVN